MTHYISDREFTNYVHEYVALKHIYSRLGWTQAKIDRDLLEQMDLSKGIDYVFVDEFNDTKYCQERFRESKYSNYNDFTIRYRRDYSRFVERQESEYSKIEADIFVYGITNGEKSVLESNTKFIKFAVIDLDIIFELIESKRIQIDITSKLSYIDNNVFFAGYNENSDYSSSFIVFDIKELNNFFNEENVIIIQEGFY